MNKYSTARPVKRPEKANSAFFGRSQWNKHPLVAALTCLLFAGKAAAIEPGAEQLAAGIAQFKQGNYETALMQLETAQQFGNRQPQLFYNLGVTHYKLKMYRQAIADFQQVQGTELAAPAQLNIGLCWEALGDEAKARSAFRAARTSGDDRVAYLAGQRLGLKTVRDERARGDHPFGNLEWDVYANFAGGYDDNVNLVAQDAPSQQADSYTQSYVSARLGFANSARVYASMFDINYADVDTQDFRIGKVGMDYPMRAADWYLLPSVNIFQSTLMGSDYQDGFDFKLKARRYFGNNAFTTSYRYSDFDASEPLFEPTAGDRHRLRFEYEVPTAFGELRGRYQYETNDRSDSLSRSYSPERHSLALRYKNSWNALQGYFDLDWRSSDYGTVATVTREDERLRSTLGASYRLTSNWNLGFRYQYTDNDSNLPEERYSRNLYLLDVSFGLPRL
ncbi:tetratricopeptide repeat protein [Microbulbifer hainanensis]|uniref:tetratricopeptide repeat protein n=1 Tax=Microbulbifer hainanensis TaxID=2735675 RepID=UPI001868A537|nr:tetratricopeptide repeat protein [Microbulbifer hainanensis]